MKTMLYGLLAAGGFIALSVTFPFWVPIVLIYLLGYAVEEIIFEKREPGAEREEE